MGTAWSQTFAPKPKFTENALSDLQGKVYIVTGASAGLGKELARVLYLRNATVYLAARNPEKTNACIEWIKQSHPNSSGTLHFLQVDFSDLESIKPAAQSFLERETRLDILFNNAGIMNPPKGTVTKQGYELTLGTNCVGPFLFTKLLTPLLVSTAQTSPAGSVRVIWVSSGAACSFSPKGGVDMQNLDYKVDKSGTIKYSVSKAGNVLHAMEFRRRYGGEKGVVSIALNPGNFRSEVQRHMGFVFMVFYKALAWILLYPAVYGAYTCIYAGFSPEVPSSEKGSWIWPFGRLAPLRKDIAEGGNGKEFWEWCEEQVEKYA